MPTASIPPSNSLSWSTAPDQNPSHRETNALDAQISSFSFPPKMPKEAQIAEHSHLGKPYPSSTIGQQSEFLKFEPGKPNFKSYRSMSTPGFFPLKRRQSNSPLRMISYTEETSSQPCVAPDDYPTSLPPSPNGTSPTLWSPSISRSSISDSDPKMPFQYLRRTSTPGTFTLKHMRRPSPLGMGSIGEILPSPSVSSFGTGSFFSDVTEHSHFESESNGPSSRPSSHVHRAASLDGTYLDNSNSGECKSWGNQQITAASNTQYHCPTFPRFSRSSGSFSLKHQTRPSPLGTQLSLSVSSSPVKQLIPLQTIVDESSSTATQK